MRKGFIVVLEMMALLLAGCAEMAVTGAGYDLNNAIPGVDGHNSKMVSTSEEVQRAYGLNSRVTNTWQLQGGKWVLVASHEGHGQGMVQTMGTAAAGTVPLIPAAALIRPSNITQNDGGVAPGAVTATSGAATATSTATATGAGGPGPGNPGFPGNGHHFGF